MSLIRNIYYDKPLIGRMTQGSIINGCVADAFPNEEVYGLIITPRCDVNHEKKVDSVHYLPIVPFERWFEVIAKPKIKDIWKKIIYQKLNDEFKKAKINDVMSTGLNHKDLLKICNTKVTNTNIKTTIEQLLNSYFGNDEDDFNYYLLEGEGKDKKRHELIKYLARLEGNDIAPFYLIESWSNYDSLNSNKHLVIMLRDIHRIQFPTAMSIKKGIYEKDIQEIDLRYNDLFLSEKHNNFFYVQAEINSPFIEHIMQSFVYNFSRIGVDDRPGSTIDYLFNSVKSTIK